MYIYEPSVSFQGFMVSLCVCRLCTYSFIEVVICPTDDADIQLLYYAKLLYISQSTELYFLWRYHVCHRPTCISAQRLGRYLLHYFIKILWTKHCWADTCLNVCPAMEMCVYRMPGVHFIKAAKRQFCKNSERQNVCSTEFPFVICTLFLLRLVDKKT